MAPANRFIAVASGKGGVGKTTLAVNLAWTLAKTHSVCLIDADLGLANVDIVLGLQPRYTLEHVLFEDVPLRKALTYVNKRLDVLSGGSGVPRLAALTRAQRSRLFWEFQKLDHYDYVLVDCSPGISPQVLSLCLSAKELVVVITPDATAITDGYALIKVLRENGLQFPPLVAVNNCQSQAQAKAIFDKLHHASRKFLGQTLLYLGGIPRQLDFHLEFERHTPLTDLKPESPATAAIQTIADRIRRRPRQRLFLQKPEDFWEKAVVQLQSRTDREIFTSDKLLLQPSPADPEESLTFLDRYLEGLLHTSNTPSHLNNGFLLRLGKLSEKIDALARRSRDAEPQDKTALRDAVGIVSPDTEMRSLLSDIVLDTNFSPVDLLSEPSAVNRVRLVLYCLERKDLRLDHFGANLHNTPGILLTGYASGNHSFLRQNNIRRVITKPFNVKEIYQALEELGKESVAQE